MQTLTLINNYQLLDLLGLLEPINGLVKLPSNALILKDNIPIPELPNSPTFTMDRLFNNVAFEKDELETTLDNLPYLRHLRVFFGRFRPDENGRITHKAGLWDKIKAWRFDIDVVKDEDLARDKEEANKRIDAKLEELLALIEDKKLPLAPNLLKRSNKGWHLIYVFDEWITRDAYETYKKERKNPFNVPDDSITDQFKVFELLTNQNRYITKFIAELEPQLDEGASINIAQIATRFITEDLPAYLIHEPYSLKEFRKAFEYLMDKVKDEEVMYKQDKTPYTTYDIPKETFLSLMDRCDVLKALDEDWENHGNNEWYVMINYYAIRILYADTPQEAEELRQEFHDKSRRWRGNGKEHYTYEEAESKLDYYIKKQAEGLKPPTCRYIFNNLDSKYKSKCLICQYSRFVNGNIISNFIFDGLKEDSLEDIHIPGWELRPDGWYVYEAGKDEEVGRYVRAIGFFKIGNHFFVGDKEFVSIVDARGITKIVPVERKKDTYITLPTLIQQLYINPDKVSEIKRFLTKYIEAVKERRGVKINFLGYRYVNGFWDIAVGGDGNYRRKDLGYLIFDREIDGNWFSPTVQGSLDTFKAIYYQAFLLNDPALHLVIAHYLSWIGEQFIDTKSLKPQINPVLILVGDAGTGKSIRAKIGAGIFGNPAVFSFTNITQAGFNNRFPLIKAPIGIDEVITKSQRDEEKLGELLYNIGNKSGKMNAYATHDPIDVPILLTGETENLLIDKVFASYRGLNRRSIVIKMTTEWRDNSDMLDMILDELHDHYGHVLSYVKSLKPEDKEVIEKEAQKIYNRIELGDTAFKEIRKHLAVSLATFKHFFIHFIGFNLEDKEVDKKIGEIISFVIKEINENQLYQIGETIDPIQEILSFISSVNKAINKNGETLRGMTFKKVKNKIDYKPSHKVEEILKRFFWDKYTSGTTTNLRFRDNSLLFDLPAPTQEDINDNAEKILKDFTTEDFSLWLRVAEVRFGKKGLERIKELLLKSDYRNELQKKFPTLLNPTTTKTISQPQPQQEPEPEIPF